MKALFFLFNIEGYGEFFSGITPFTTNIMSSNPVPGKVKLIQHYVIQFVFGGFLWVLRFPPPIKLIAMM